jgi:hypothetical protein
MSMEERAARRVILAHAIETGDADRKLLSQAERDHIDSQARQAALTGSGDEARVDAARFLQLRARRVVEAIEARNPGLAALQHGGAWQHWIAAGLPLGALALGVLTDAVANPHRVDLLSLPLLGLVAWNLVMYTALFAGWLLWPRPRRGDAPQHQRAESLLRWRRGRSGHVRAEITALFHLRWQRATQALSLYRLKRTLHLAAAAWAVGVALSLLARGLVVEYRVGWESTFLDAGQVHAVLSGLRLPALLLFPFQPFSVPEVAALQFSHGGGAPAGARWVFMYVALLLVVVVVPRLALAAWAYWRERWLARRVPVDVRDAYFQRLLSLLSATRVHLCLLAQRPADRAALLRVLAQEPDAGGALITSPHGDVLRLVDVSGMEPPPASRRAGANWLARWSAALGRPTTKAASGAAGALASARELGDVVLQVAQSATDADAARPLLQWLDKPVLVLVNGAAGAGLFEQPPLVREVLPFDRFARCWTHERVLLDAVARCLPQASRPGFDRIVAAWEQRHAARLQQAMAAVAEHLLYSARQTQEVDGAPLGVKSLAAAEREAHARGRQAAMDAIVTRLEVSAGEMFSRLRVLHGMEASEAAALQHRLQEKFVVQRAVDLPQAGMAGAASGAAMGASVDLLVGGLTLGAATALGALVGGGAAYIAAAWKNRSTPNGTTLVQLSDEMLQAMTEAALLRYLAVAQHGRGSAGDADEMPAAWTADVVAAVDAHRERLAPLWAAARSQPEPGRLISVLARELETIARKVLATLFPAR